VVKAQEQLRAALDEQRLHAAHAQQPYAVQPRGTPSMSALQVACIGGWQGANMQERAAAGGMHRSVAGCAEMQE